MVFNRSDGFYLNSKLSIATSPETSSLPWWAAAFALLTLVCSLVPADIWTFSSGIYLPLHSVAELFSVIVGAMVFALIWEQHWFLQKRDLMLGAAFLSAALLDVGHVLSYAGMPDFVSPSSAQKAIAFWLAARLVAALAIFAYALQWPSSSCVQAGCRSKALISALVVTASVYWLPLWHLEWLPETYVPGEGLTHFKVACEYFIMALNAAAAWMLYCLWRREGGVANGQLALAAWVMLLGEWFFSRYVQASDFSNLLGHIYKVIAYGLVYRGLVHRLVREPYARAERAAFRSRVVIDSSLDGIFALDQGGRLVEANEAFARQLGHPLADLLGHSMAEIDSSHDLQRWSGQAGAQVFETRLRCRGGHLVAVEISLNPFEGEGEALYVGIARNLVSRREMEELRLARTVFETADSGIMVTDARERILDVNPAFSRITGYPREEVLGQTPRLLKSGHHEESFYQAMWQELQQQGQWQGEVRNLRKDKGEYVAQVTITAVPSALPDQLNYVAQISDVTALKQNQQQLSRLAHFDALTQLPNRVLLADRLNQATAVSRRSNTQLGVCYLDLDGFKAVNDSLGHQAGDELLVEVARRLERNLRAGDTAARLGGDEFAVLLGDLKGEEDCSHAMRRLLAALAAPYVIGGNTCDQISASIGVTLYPLDVSDADNLLRHPDQAMYAAKKAGKNCYRLFDANLEQRMEARMETLRRVARGIARGQFMLYYQPKVDCKLNRVRGLEALIRWEHPVLGMLSPDSFLPVVEEDEIALVMGEWVLREALRQMRAWHEAGVLVPVSINAFSLQLSNRRFPKLLSQAIEEIWPQLPPGMMVIEIVETSALKELEVIEQIISDCRELGVHFSLDDFGTGYSSLVYLRRLSVDELKIDQSFVRDMLNDEQDYQIIDGIVSLGRGFRLQVVAEGVETEAQARALHELGCDLMQGYHFSRPMPADQVPSWLGQFQQEYATKECSNGGT